MTNNDKKQEQEQEQEQVAAPGDNTEDINPGSYATESFLPDGLLNNKNDKKE